ncbi:hypothetical protein WT00_08175 [Burkholderia territorii]|nr:hypothetical protein WT00_08175 [Burkholderia territorii]
MSLRSPIGESVVQCIPKMWVQLLFTNYRDEIIEEQRIDFARIALRIIAAPISDVCLDFLFDRQR